MTFIPPLIGVIIFSYLVKFSNNDLVPKRLPIYQGVSSYFSLLLTGFSYINERKAVKGKNIINILIFLTLLPIFFYYSALIDKSVIILVVLICFFSSMIQYFLLLKGNIFFYLFYSIINSIILPLCLILENISFFIVLILLVCFLLFLYFKIKDELSFFSAEIEGIGVLNSILFHSPFIILPFFDYKIQALIGMKHYENYVLLNKYINGFITLLFSYVQLTLVFTKELKKFDIIINSLVIIVFFSIICMFIQSNISFVILIFLYSLAVNLSSLVIRSKLMKGVSFLHALQGFIFVVIYFVCLNIFKINISKNHQIFIFLMIVFTVLPSFFILKKQ